MISNKIEIIELSDDEIACQNNCHSNSRYEYNCGISEETEKKSIERLSNSVTYSISSNAENISSSTSHLSPQKRTKRFTTERENIKLQKEVNKVLREVSALKNGKCERALFCHINSSLFKLIDIENTLKKIFLERNIFEQLIFEQKDMMVHIKWYRKCINAFISDNKLLKTSNLELQGTFVRILMYKSFSQLLQSNSLDNFVEENLSNFNHHMPQLYLIIFGRNTFGSYNFSEGLLKLYEKYGVQIRFTETCEDLGLLVAQLHRTIAKLEKKNDQSIYALQRFDKGVADGLTIAKDWWMRMLGQIYNITECQKRAIIKNYPDPFLLMDIFANKQEDALFELSQIKDESSRRLGPILSQKLYKILTSIDGKELIDNTI